MWSDYVYDPDLYQETLRKLLWNETQYNTPAEISLAKNERMNLVINETNNMDTCELNQYPVDLLVGIRLMTDGNHRFRLYCTDIFLGEYQTKGKQIIRLKKVVPFLYFMKTLCLTLCLSEWCMPLSSRLRGSGS